MVSKWTPPGCFDPSKNCVRETEGLRNCLLIYMGLLNEGMMPEDSMGKSDFVVDFSRNFRNCPVALGCREV